MSATRRMFRLATRAAARGSPAAHTQMPTTTTRAMRATTALRAAAAPGGDHALGNAAGRCNALLRHAQKQRLNSMLVRDAILPPLPPTHTHSPTPHALLPPLPPLPAAFNRDRVSVWRGG
jgi:hypothetical protein